MRNYNKPVNTPIVYTAKKLFPAHYQRQTVWSASARCQR